MVKIMTQANDRMKKTDILDLGKQLLVLAKLVRQLLAA